MILKKIFFTILGFFFLLNLVRAETVLATTKITYADTILAKVISEVYGYPQILLERDKLSYETLSLLQALNVSEIIIIGGPAVVSPGVEEELRNKGYNVIRIWGVERYETSALVAKYFWDSSEEAVLLTEDLAHERANFRILSLVREAVDYAVDKKIPILITTAGNLERNVIDALITLGVKRVYIFTLVGNLSKIEEELKELNISYEIFRAPLPKNCTPIRIGVLETALWNLSPETLIYKRCVEIIPIKENITTEELINLNISIVIYNLNNSKEFRERFVNREMLNMRLRNRERLSSLLKERVYDMLVDILSRSDEIPLTIRKCYYDILSKIKKDGEEEYNVTLDCLSKINEYRWRRRLFVQDFKKQKIEEIRKNLTVNYRNITIELNLSKELNISEENIGRWMPDPLEIREKLREMVIRRVIYRSKKDKLCIQVITCACSPFGRCAEFPTPCDVPPFWNVVSCEEIGKTSGKIRVLPKE